MILLLLPLFLLSCNRGNIFEEYRKFDNIAWNRFDILIFDVNVEDTEAAYNLFISFRHLPEFTLEELKINFTITSPSGSERTSDNILEFYDREGKSLSSCMGDLCDILIPVKEGFYFSEKGLHRIEIENKWPKAQLPGIMEVGLVARKSGG